MEIQRGQLDFFTLVTNPVSSTANMDGDPSALDKRFKYIKEIVLTTFKIKPDCWQKCLSIEEQKQTIQNFLDSSEHTKLFVNLNSNGQLIPENDFTSASTKNKAVYFIKRSRAALAPDDMRENLVYGEMSPTHLEQFSALVDEVGRVLTYEKNFSFESFDFRRAFRWTCFK